VLSALAGRLICDTAIASKGGSEGRSAIRSTHLAQTQLKTGRREEIPAAQVPGTYSTAESLIHMVEVNETDAWLSLALMFHLSTLPLTRQLTNLSGNSGGGRCRATGRRGLNTSFCMSSTEKVPPARQAEREGEGGCPGCPGKSGGGKEAEAKEGPEGGQRENKIRGRGRGRGGGGQGKRGSRVSCQQ